MLIRAFALFLLTASFVAAEELPALYDVAGVASDDVLNVRTRPMAGANIIGTLAHDAQSVEVVEIEGDWGRVNVDEGSGWASMAYLHPLPESAMPDAPRLRCFGTEPFWSLNVTQSGAAILSTPEGSDRAFTVGNWQTASARPEPFAMLGTGQGENITLVVGQEICSDGMSDNLFGLDGTIVIGGYLNEVLSGCCSVQVE
ncbi:COG3650 family protein [Pelagimonas varians]|uniref:Bacterial SH3 domain protein n=1 Tax=Pelagimonas varians TaxID=696760 RepID=A0A238KL32_9RHOB|nr:SH3 domain-containing protein [Pelagimonas varians]PYG29173.1 SH3 domain-containing protein [Pelagimonas varians]SMX43453.1 Bacterial SH3 domain protein [Pelagimonas varians]